MSATAVRRTLRIASYNVHSCIGTDRRHDPERIARVVTELDADVVALQEFRYPADVALETRTPTVLTSLERYDFALGPTRARDADSFGNVLLSRHPIRDLFRVDLSRRRREPRGALAVTIDVGSCDLHVIATHLGLRFSERRFQVRQLIDHIAARDPAFLVVLGDFNDWLPGRSVAHVLDARLGAAVRPRTFPSWCPMLPLDRIWVRPPDALVGMEAHRSPLARRASDHLPVVATIAVPGPASDGGGCQRVRAVADARESDAPRATRSPGARW
jgi:endonuclease/exonuclease/phosphatase family metal-dependent hydrolase